MSLPYETPLIAPQSGCTQQELDDWVARVKPHSQHLLPADRIIYDDTRHRANSKRYYSKKFKKGPAAAAEAREYHRKQAAKYRPLPGTDEWAHAQDLNNRLHRQYRAEAAAQQVQSIAGPSTPSDLEQEGEPDSEQEGGGSTATATSPVTQRDCQEDEQQSEQEGGGSPATATSPVTRWSLENPPTFNDIPSASHGGVFQTLHSEVHVAQQHSPAVHSTPLPGPCPDLSTFFSQECAEEGEPDSEQEGVGSPATATSPVTQRDCQEDEEQSEQEVGGSPVTATSPVTEGDSQEEQEDSEQEGGGSQATATSPVSQGHTDQQEGDTEQEERDTPMTASSPGSSSSCVSEPGTPDPDFVPSQQDSTSSEEEGAVGTRTRNAEEEMLRTAALTVMMKIQRQNEGK